MSEAAAEASESASVSGARTADALAGGIACLGGFVQRCAAERRGGSAHRRPARSGVELSCAKADESGALEASQVPGVGAVACHALASLRATGERNSRLLAAGPSGWLLVQGREGALPLRMEARDWAPETERLDVPVLSGEREALASKFAALAAHLPVLTSAREDKAPDECQAPLERSGERPELN